VITFKKRVVALFVERSSRQQWRLEDLRAKSQYDRDGNDLKARGLYLDMSPWQAHGFSMTKKMDGCRSSDEWSVIGNQ
jgi:hypothetical protein